MACSHDRNKKYENHSVWAGEGAQQLRVLVAFTEHLDSHIVQSSTTPVPGGDLISAHGVLMSMYAKHSYT